MSESKKILAAMIPAEPGWRAVYALLDEAYGYNKVPIEIKPVIAWAGYNHENGEYADEPMHQSFGPVVVDYGKRLEDSGYGLLGLVTPGEEVDVDAYEIAAIDSQLHHDYMALRNLEKRRPPHRDEDQIAEEKEHIAQAKKLRAELVDAYRRKYPDREIR